MKTLMREGKIYRSLLIAAAILIVLSACAPATQVAPVIDNTTTTPSPIPTATQIALWTETPTSSITPLPTIPTFTPTFDVSTIVTVTPAPKAECPNLNLTLTNYQFSFGLYPNGSKYVDSATINSFMAFLNDGGEIEKVIKILSDIHSTFTFQDLTNDNKSDLILISGSLFQSLDIIYCQDGQYVHFPNESESGNLFGDSIQFDIQDINQNNIRDVLSINRTPTGLVAKIWEWDGQSFMDLTPNEVATSGTVITTVEIRDINDDDISEMIENGQPYKEPYPGQPLRIATNIYYWNGRIYSSITTFSSPQYRFQAVQDGDFQALRGYYDEAIKLYQNTIDSDKFDWWSKERFERHRESAINFTTPSVLASDETEYPRLAAYVYYRIMLLHIMKGNESDAHKVYNTLQEKFGSDQYGRPYIELATEFWNAYQSTHKMYDGCAAAIQYAAEHPEILVPLGSD